MIRRALKFALAAAAVKFFFDPQSGARRRQLVVDRATALLRGGFQLGGRPSALGDEPNDATLKAKVESEVFRATDVPKGSVNVNAEDGVVTLRGELERQDMIDDLVERTRNVDGVHVVENRLHTPGEEPTPTHEAH